MSGQQKVAVGDRLWMVERRGRHNHGREVIVTKVGRKWAYLAPAENQLRDAGRMDIEDMVLDGGEYISPGRCFRSQQEYEDRLRLAEAWEELRKKISASYRRPEHLTLAGMEQIARILDPSLPRLTRNQENV